MIGTMEKPQKYSPARILKLRVNHAVKRHSNLYLTISRWRHRPYRGPLGTNMIYSEAIGRHTDVVIEGPPRSGNTFAVVAFQVAQGQPVSIAHHLHAAPQVTAAAKMDLPTIVLLRNPEDAVVSHAASFGVPLKLALREYVQFYTDVLPIRHSFVTATFEALTTDYGGVIQAVNAKFGADFKPFNHTEENIDRCFKIIDDYYNIKSPQPKLTVARPSKKRQGEKEKVRSAFQAEGLSELRAEAFRLYEMLGRVEGQSSGVVTEATWKKARYSDGHRH